MRQPDPPESSEHFHGGHCFGVLGLELDLHVILEPGSRDIVEFCGLPWDDRCLRYHQQRRVVQTSSYDQVTRPIYGSSVGRHRNFQRQLAPLREALASAGIGIDSSP